MKLEVIGALALALWTTTAAAQDAEPADGAAGAASEDAVAEAMPVDSSADVNDDGMISFPEVLFLVPDFTAEAFTRIDTSGDGLLDAPEVEAAVAAGTLPAVDG